MTLYQLNEQIQKAIELGFDPETGEILDETALEQLQMDRDEKIENICLYIKDLYAEADAIYNERRALEEREKASEKKADSLSRYLQVMLNGQKFKTAKCAVSYRKTQAVQIVDEDALPEDFVIVYTSPRKMAIKEALKAGNAVPGAVLEDRMSMIIK